MKLSDFLTTGKASKILGVHPDTLRRGGVSKVIKAYKHPNGKWRIYKKKDIENFLKKLEGDDDREPSI